MTIDDVGAIYSDTLMEIAEKFWQIGTSRIKQGVYTHTFQIYSIKNKVYYTVILKGVTTAGQEDVRIQIHTIPVADEPSKMIFDSSLGKRHKSVMTKFISYFQ